MKLIIPAPDNKAPANPVAFTPKGGCPLKPPHCSPPLARGGGSVAFTPKGGCPLKRCIPRAEAAGRGLVAFTPKGGCPLKPGSDITHSSRPTSSVAFTPKGGCPLKLMFRVPGSLLSQALVAFTPKGGCPLKQAHHSFVLLRRRICSIHPQGWVPIETS